MDTQQIQQEIRAREIVFPSGNRARLVEPPAGAKAADIIRALDIRQPQALVLVIGGARGFDGPEKARLTQMFSRGVARAVVDVGGLIIDGGTEAGVMSMIGQGVADRGRSTPLLGVVPAGKVMYPGGPAEGSIEDGAPLDPNHSHFVLVESDVWGGETATMYALAEALANRVLGPPAPIDDSTDGRAAAQPASATIPVVTVLAGGSIQGIARDEALASVRCAWPIIVIEGSGRLADEIARLWRKKQSMEARRTPGRWNAIRRRARLWRQPALAIDDPALAEIIEEGDIQLVPLNGQVADLRHLINRLLRPPRSMTPLDLAWQRFALYDLNAARQQKHFKRLKDAAIVLGVVSTILTLTFTGLKEVFTDFEASWPGLALRLLIIVVPIATAVLLAADTRFKPGSKWTLLRAGSEEIKRAIFYYRARPDIPDDRSPVPATHEARLDQQVETVSRRLMRTDVNEAALHPYTGPIPPKMYGAAADDDGISKLSPERYITIRLGDQINFFQLKTNQLEKRLRRFQIWILVYGGMGAFLAAVGAVLWIPIAVTVVAGLTAYL